MKSKPRILVTCKWEIEQDQGGILKIIFNCIILFHKSQIKSKKINSK